MGDAEAMDDLASDMSVYHGIRDVGSVQSGTLARLALRIAVYGGAVGAHTGHVARRQPEPPAQPQPMPQPSPRRAPPGPPASAAQLAGMLARVPGSQVWGEVHTVKTVDQDQPDGG